MIAQALLRIVCGLRHHRWQHARLYVGRQAWSYCDRCFQRKLTRELQRHVEQPSDVDVEGGFR